MRPMHEPVRSALITTPSPEEGAELRHSGLTAAGRAALAVAQDFARHSASPATLRAYKADWAHYTAWCDATGFTPLPAEPAAVGAYLASLAKSHAPTSIRRRLAAIGKAHRFVDLPWNPGHRAIQEPLQGALRKLRRPVVKAAAVRLDTLKRLLATCDDSKTGRRDRAVLLVGFAGALRRSELVGLLAEDVTPTTFGLQITIRHSKTDQQGQGTSIGLAHGEFAETCPVRALKAWQAVAKRPAGPLFRKVEADGRISDRALRPDAVRQILARRAEIAGIEASAAGRLSPHGLRSGFITEAHHLGVREAEIQRHVRHRDPRTTRGYIELLELVSDTPAGKIGL